MDSKGLVIATREKKQKFRTKLSFSMLGMLTLSDLVLWDCCFRTEKF